MPLSRLNDGLFVATTNGHDGHTLAVVIDRPEKLTGGAIERAYVDKGYRGHKTIRYAVDTL
jgi:hypothetical protein